MTVLRINLHIRVDVSRVLHAALADMPPRPRAERLRKLAEIGLQVESGRLPGRAIDLATAKSPMAAHVSNGSNEIFSSDLANLIGDR